MSFRTNTNTNALAADRRIFAAVCVGALVLFLPVFMRMIETFNLYTLPGDVPHADAIMILGASVVHGDPSPILAERAGTAIALYKAGASKKILVSGDDGENNYDEVTPVLNYLLAHGVARSDIYLDHAGFDTYSSMYRARQVFGARSLLIPTQDFHVPRAVFVARMLGIKASGVTANGGKFSDYIREIPATWKALLDLLAGREPKYLGAPVPLAGWSNAGK